MIVKICANRDIVDAQMSIEAGANIIGVLVGKKHTSDDFISKEQAKEICDYAKGKISVSLVTHLDNAQDIIDLTNYIGNDMIQLHSSIKEEEVLKIVNVLPHIKIVRLIHVSKNGQIVSDISRMKYADYYLLDSFNLKTNQVGGTGLTSEWKACNEIIKKLDKPVFLAGGLNSSNVSKAIEQAQPYGVDVNSGCKDETGRKNKDKVMEFVKKAKSINY